MSAIEPVRTRGGVPWVLILRMSVSHSVASALCSTGAATFVNLYVTRELGHPDVVWASLALAFTSANVAGSLLTSITVPWLGSRRVLTLCLLAAAASYVVFATVTNVTLIMVGLLVCGAAMGMADTAHISMLLCAAPEAGGRAIAARSVVGGLTGMTILVLWGQLLDLLGYRSTFVTAAVLLGIAAPTFWALTRTICERLEAPSEQGLLQMRRTDWRAFLSPHLLVMLAFGALLEPWMGRTRVQLTPNLFSTTFGMAESTIGQVVGLSGLVTVIGCLTVGMLFQRAAPSRRWGLSMILSGACLSGMGMVGSGLSAVALLMAHQLTYVGCLCSAGVAIADAGGPRRRTMALSLGTTTYFIGMLSASLAHRLMLGAGVSLPRVFIVAGAVGAFGGLAMLLGHWGGEPELNSAEGGSLSAVEPTD